jgi:hypothetical protein
MKQISFILFSAYFLAGMLLLQQSDFSVMQDLPAMYRHCKAVEDKDLTPLDFITDHLLNLDCIFDQHDNGDPQKPHIPPQFNHQNYQNFFLMKDIELLTNKPVPLAQKLSFHSDNSKPKDYIGTIFRPPIS